jgi:Ser/Thr protein kinase RdoA (MazF antagonist)
MAAMLTGAVACVLDVLGVRPGRITVLKDVPPGNGSWLVELPSGRRAVLRRYHPGASPEDLGYEHAVLGYLADAGWAVPDPVGDPVCHGGLWYCLTRYLPGRPASRPRRPRAAAAGP